MKDASEVQQRELITSSLARGITAVRGSLFLSDLDRKDDSYAIALDFLRVPPFRSISSSRRSPRPFRPFSSSLSRLSFPCGVLRRAFALRPTRISSLFARRIQFLPSSADALSIFPALLPTSGVASAYRFRCAPTPERAFVLLLSISRARAPRDVFVRVGIRVVRTANERDAPRRINLFRLAVRGRKSRISRQSRTPRDDDDDMAKRLDPRSTDLTFFCSFRHWHDGD